MIGETAWHVVSVCVVAMCVVAVCVAGCVQEQVFDYVFSHLGIDTDGRVDHPIVITEPVCSPTHSRQSMFLIGHCRL